MFPHIDCDEFRNLFNEKESGRKDKNEQEKLAVFEKAINKIGEAFENSFKKYMNNLLGDIRNEKSEC